MSWTFRFRRLSVSTPNLLSVRAATLAGTGPCHREPPTSATPGAQAGLSDSSTFSFFTATAATARRKMPPPTSLDPRVGRGSSGGSAGQPRTPFRVALQSRVSWPSKPSAQSLRGGGPSLPQPLPQARSSHQLPAAPLPSHIASPSSQRFRFLRLLRPPNSSSSPSCGPPRWKWK